jgi:tRNA 5-methylaminomethyl-2-thiouridine biosynthesis bifunctional protein
VSGFDPGAAWEGDSLVSTRFGDVYASRQGALAQSRAVFLAGCGLPEAWRGRRRFTVAELGFGTGLNMLAVLEAWARSRPEGATLHLFSVEGFPLAAADARRMLGRYPELATLAAPLLAHWPTARGWHRFDWPELGAVLDLAVQDAGEALAGWEGRADAWLLDGFSPARNPDMWSTALLAEVARTTMPGGRAATWSVAAPVREGLAAAGFAVRKEPGFGHKSQRLEAKMPGAARFEPRPRVAIIGAGIAGAALAAAFRDLGVASHVFAEGPMASGNPSALVSPRLAAASGTGAAFHAQAFLRAVARIRDTAPQAVIARGVLRRLAGRGEAERGVATVASGLFPEGSLELRKGGTALWVADALVVSPERLRAAWLPEVQRFCATGLERRPDGWWLLGDGRAEGPFDTVCLAAGFGTAALGDLPLRPVRGQVSLADVSLAGPPESWGGYVIPTDTGLLFGATHDRGDSAPEVRGADQLRNLEGLARVKPDLAARLGAERLGAIAGVRAAAGDHQPLAGALGDGLFVLGGLGGRGFTLAPLLAEHVGSQVVGAPSPLPAAMARLVDPARLGPATRAGDGDVRRDNP